MRVLGRGLLFSSLLFAFSLSALADPVDYKSNILDPDPPPPGAGFTTYPITSQPYTFSFTACQANELPNGLTAEGCFAGVNRTGSPWTSVEMIVPNTAVTAGQPVSCNTEPSDEIFSSPSCGLVTKRSAAFPNGYYDLLFKGGSLSDFFFITEDGIPPDEFPPVTLTFTTANSVTPEPSSWVLLATGLASAVQLRLRSRRRRES